jgi:hypothetical protein
MTEYAKPDNSEASIADDLELTADETEQVTGGRSALDVSKTPTPGGPVPLPYPNVSGR